MNFEKYVEFTDTTAKYPGANTDNHQELMYLALGLAGETGETVDVIKKWVRSDFKQPLNVPALKLELGDVLYYFARILKVTGMTLEEVATANIAKLTDRLKNDKIITR